VYGVGVEPDPRFSFANERTTLAWLDPSADELRVWTSTQSPFRVRAELAASLGYPESRIRVVAPQVGGGFGVKGSPYREDVLVAWLALRLGRPVKWVATRDEDTMTTQQGRGMTADAELAVGADGVIRGARARIGYPMGGRFRPCGATGNSFRWQDAIARPLPIRRKYFAWVRHWATMPASSKRVMPR